MKLISLVKPGIVFGNTVTLSGGYFVGIKESNFSSLSFLASLFGMMLVIASGCVLNNYIDRDIDKMMERTRMRPSACGLVSLKFALNYAFLLGFFGFFLLYIGTNFITIVAALIGLLTYVVAYTLWFKRSTVFGTVIGAVSGALPPVIGYTAATGRLGSVAVVLFLILFCWQMPHFFAIAIYRLKDYADAEIPVLPLKRGVFYTKINMLVFIILYIAASIMLSVIAVNNIFYLITVVVLGFVWLLLSVQGFVVSDSIKWARKMFLFSIVSITLLSIAMSLP